MYSGIIYKYTSPSGKCYVGQTLNEKRRRYTFLNIKQSYGSPKINNARKKYSPETFEYEVLFTYKTSDIDELRKVLGDQEIFYIKQLDTINQGYNCQEGGLHQINVMNEDSRKSQIIKVSKVVLQYSIDGTFIREWSSTMEIERELGIQHSLISQNCLGKTSHCREFLFRYKDGDEISSTLVIEKEIKIKNTRKLTIAQMDIEGNQLKQWKTITEAAKELHMCRHNLKKLAESGKEYNNFTYKLIK